MAISTSYGQSADYFGHDDYFGNLNAGYTPLEIFNYLRSNTNLLKGELNQPGGGGVYDYAQQQALEYSQKQSTDLTAEFQQQLDAQTQKQEEQQKAYQEALSRMRQQFLANRSSAGPQVAQVSSPGSGLSIRRAGSAPRFNRPELRLKSINI